MNIFDGEFGEFKMLNFDNFFEDIQKGAMDSGYDLFLVHGIKGMKVEMGSKDPISLANKLIDFFIKYEEYEKCAKLVEIINEYEKEQKTKTI